MQATQATQAAQAAQAAQARAGPATPSAGAAAAWARRLLLGAAIALIVIAIYYVVRRVMDGLDRFTIERTTAYRSTVDGLPYRVHAAHGSPQEAANLLAQLNERVLVLLRALRAKYVRDSRRAAEYPGRAKAAARLLGRYNPDNLAENSPLDPSGDTSYTVDKGTLVALCLRERGPRPPGDAANSFHSPNLLAFVALHELAHIAIEAVDHPPAFWSAFKFILEEAAAAGVYAPEDYARRPLIYCGLTVNFSPLFDPGTATLV